MIPVSNISVVGVRSSTRGRGAMDRPALDVLGQVIAQIDRLAQQIEDAPQRGLPHRDRDRRLAVDDLGPAGQAVCRVHGHRAHPVVAQVLLDFADQVVVLSGSDIDVLLLARHVGARNQEGVVDLGQLLRENGLDDDALDLLDPSDVLLFLVVAARGGWCLFGY